MFTDLMKSGTFSPLCSRGIIEASAWVSVNPHRSRQLSLENFWPAKRIFCLYYRFQVSELCCFLSPLWKEGKKKNNTSFSSSLRTKENGFDREPLHSEHPSKRPCTISPGQRYSPNNGLSYQPNGLPHPTPPPQHYRLDDMAIAHHYRDSYRHPSHRDLRDRNRPMGKTEGSLQFLGDGVLQDLHPYCSAKLQAWNLWWGKNTSSWSNVSFMRKLRWC